MKIKEIYIDNYRNLSGLTIKFDSIMNFVIGNNGVGKSNLMELIDTVFNKNAFKEKDFSDTEYLFGGTSIKREAGKEISITCNLEVDEGTAKVFWSSGAEEPVTLIETTGEYQDTITLPDGGNYIGIECENFTGNIKLEIE